MRLFKSIMKILIISLLVAVAYLCGVYVAKYQQNQEENKSTITTIAVVNADVGAMVDSEKVFYSNELMFFPDTNFKSAGLEDAREGVVDGRYAAYILIPENFSNSIESINSEPDKAQITYALHDNLRQDVQIKVVNDIHNFILSLSSNVSYLYVDAILEEMHNVQNDSNTIMDNDVRDMKAIVDMETADLISEVEYEPLEVAEIEIEYMDLTDDYELVNITVENIYDTYSTNMTAAEEEFLAIKDNSSSLNEQLAATTDIFSTVDILLDIDGNSVYENGMDALLGVTETYEDGRDEKLEAKKSLGYEVNDEEIEEENEEEQEGEQYISKDDLLELVDSQEEYLIEISTAIENGEDTEEKIATSIEGLNTLREQINKYYSDAIIAIDNIPVLAELPDEVHRIVREEIAAPITEEVLAEKEKVVVASDSLLAGIGEYIAVLEEYDAISYLETDVIEEYMSSLFTTIGDMENKIEEQDELYMEYIDEVTRITDSNVEMLQKNLETAYTKTQENIDFTIRNFKENRTNINALNISLLDGITQKLPYTRLGNLEYTQVYDFIVEPVVSNDQSIVKNEITDTSVNMDWIDLVCMFMGIMALILFYITVHLIHKNLFQKEKGKEEELCMME